MIFKEKDSLEDQLHTLEQALELAAPGQERQRCEKQLPEDARIYRMDKLVGIVRKTDGSPLDLWRVVSPETLHAFAVDLVRHHKPAPKPKFAVPRCDGVQIRRTRRQANGGDARSLEDHPEIVAKHAGPIMDEIAVTAQEPVQTVRQISRHLLHPRPLRFGNDAADVNLPRGQPNHEENVITDHTQGGLNLHVEKVGCGQDIPMGPQELFPGGPFLPVRGRVHPCLLQHPGNGPAPDLMAQVLQSALNPRITPGAVLRRHSQDEVAHGFRRGRPTGRPLGATIVFPGDESLMPSQVLHFSPTHILVANSEIPPSFFGTREFSDITPVAANPGEKTSANHFPRNRESGSCRRADVLVEQFCQHERKT